MDDAGGAPTKGSLPPRGAPFTRHWPATPRLNVQNIFQDHRLQPQRTRAEDSTGSHQPCKAG